jgi:hypothetical protein
MEIFDKENFPPFPKVRGYNDDVDEDTGIRINLTIFLIRET